MSDIAPAATQTQPQDVTFTAGDAGSGETVPTFVVEEGDPALPDAIAAAPFTRPGSEAETSAIMTTEAETTLQAQAAALQAQTALQQPAPGTAPQSPQPAATAAPASEAATAAIQAQPSDPTSTPASAQVETAALATGSAAPAKKRSFLSAFFSPARPAAATAQPKTARPLIDPTASAPVAASATAPAQPLVQLAATEQAARPLISRNQTGDSDSLPGVRPDALFEITRRSGIDDDSDIDLHEDEPSYQVASAAGMARLAPNGLLKQTDNVDIACLKPSLVRVLKAVEKHYGRKVVVTSGYRSPDRNRRARGARNSLHMYCAAADVQVEGVSKWDLAQYVRSMPGRGGVGTYCHTESVHIDVGPERDWNWRCRRRK